MVVQLIAELFNVGGGARTQSRRRYRAPSRAFLATVVLSGALSVAPASVAPAQAETESTTFEKMQRSAGNGADSNDRARFHGLLSDGADLSDTKLPVFQIQPAVSREVQSEPGKLRLIASELSNAFQNGVSELSQNILRRGAIELSGNYYLSDDAIRDQLQFEQPEWFWQSSPTEVEQRLIDLPWIRKASAHWQIYPLKLRVEVVEHEPWMVAEMASDSWLISHDGHLIVPLSQLHNPALILKASELARLDGLESQQQPQEVSSRADARFRYAIDILKLLELGGGMPFVVERYHLRQDRGLEVFPLEWQRYPRVIFGPEDFDDAQHKLSQLRVVLNDLEQRGESAELLDLRFNDQVVLRESAHDLSKSNSR